jgi:hypothetical protein
MEGKRVGRERTRGHGTVGRGRKRAESRACECNYFRVELAEHAMGKNGANGGTRESSKRVIKDPTSFANNIRNIVLEGSFVVTIVVQS